MNGEPARTRSQPAPLDSPRTALTVAVAALGVVAAATVRLRGLDVGWFLAVNGSRLVPEPVWEALSLAGLGLTALLVVAVLARREPAVVAALAWTFVIGGGIVQLAKRFVATPRPAAVLPAGEVHLVGERLMRNAFPSGHTLTAVAVVTVLWLVGGRAWRRPWAVAGAGALAALVGASRIATGAHWPADVLAGAVLGWATACGSVRLARVTRLDAWFATRSGGRALGAIQLGAGVGMAVADTGYRHVGWLQVALAAVGIAVGAWSLAGDALRRVWAGLRHAGEARRRLARIAAAWSVGVVLLAWLTRGVDWRHLGDAVRPAPWWAWGATVLALLASYALRAARIRSELRAHGVGFADCLRVMLVHNAAVNVLPLRGGEATYPWLVHRTLGVPLGAAVASLVWIRLQDAVVLALAAIAGWPGIPAPHRAVAALALVAGVTAGVQVLRRGAATWSRHAGSPRAPVRAVHRALQALADAPGHRLAGWAFCVGSWTVKLAAIGALLAAVSGIGAVAGARGALGGELAGVLPLQGPAGLGTYEAGVWAGVSLAGASAAAIAAPALAVHVLSLLVAITSGAMAHAARPRRVPSSSPGGAA
jgi:membrane-associated phospholipid phosphatase/uncharacterized membrane protein YbhN (UPF0104 family)